MNTFARTLSALLIIASPFAVAGHHGEQQTMKEHMKSHSHEAHAGGVEGELEAPAANETLFRVNGIVCSFCAAGVTKKLSKLDGVNSERYTKGVFVDIEHQRVTVAMQPGAKLDMKAAYKAIRKGGYEPVKAISADGDGQLTRFNAEAKACDASC